MKNNKNIILIILLVVVLSISCVFTSSNIINTKTKTYLAANDDLVSTRELAMLASLVYEDVPDDRVYVESAKTRGLSGGCLNSDGTLINGCFFKEHNGMVKLNGSDYTALQYIEGMSQRKASAVMSKALNSFVEDGQKYYFLNYADVSELSGSWTIYDYETTNPNVKEGKKVDTVTLNNYFDAITFKKGNNYVIAYRGTDFPDLSEWISNFTYAIAGEHSQASQAYNYAIEVYKKATAESANAKFFVTGHSLGAYLAQIGGAAIVDYELGYNDVNRTPMTYDEYVKNAKKGITSKLNQVAYFNGMGVSGLFKASNLSKNVANALTHLAITDLNGERATTDRYVNYSDSVKSSGRLVLYSMDVDPISDIGFHYGEILKLDVGADAVMHHRGTHSLDLAEIGEGLKKTDELKPEEIAKAVSSMWDTFVYDMKNSDNTNNLSVEEEKNVLNESINLLDKNNSFLSTFVVNDLKEQGIKTLKTYNLGSILANIVTNAISYAGKTSTGIMESIFEYFNVNHETDSFMCLVDQANGDIKYEDITVSIEPINLTADADGVYTIDSKTYKVPDGYEIGDPIDRQKALENGDSFLILKADVNGCAKKYQFMQNGKPIEIPMHNNEIIIPLDYLKKNLSKSVSTKKFKVDVMYGNDYYIAKSTVGPLNVITYKSDKKNVFFGANPTGYVADHDIHHGVATRASQGKDISLKVKAAN